MTRCTFFRGFTAYNAAGILVSDPWPFVANLIENHFKHNDGLSNSAEYYIWSPPVRNQPHAPSPIDAEPPR